MYYNFNEVLSVSWAVFKAWLSCMDYTI